MSNLRLIILLSILVIAVCSGQKSSPEKWYKGNLHTHSYWSDGDEFPEVIMDWYKSNGYHFVALSDHNTLARGEKWKKIRKDSIYQNAFKNYLQTYGSGWVQYKVDSLDQTHVKLKTYGEYKSLFEELGKFLIIQAAEITDHYENKPLHMGAINIQEEIRPQGGNSVVEVLQSNLDAVLQQREALNKPMLAHVNHPNFQYAVSLEDMKALRNERFFEVYNGHHLVNNSGDSTHMATETMWDLINIAYLNNDKPLIYGLATDDSHNYHLKGRKWSNSGRGWVVVRADSLNPGSIIEAMEAGNFYSSTGVELEDVKWEDNTFSVEVKKEKGIDYQISFIGCKKDQTEPEQLMSVRGNKASYELTKDVLFVRCKVVSSKLHTNPIEDLLYETAWTQPVIPGKRAAKNK